MLYYIFYIIFFNPKSPFLRNITKKNDLGKSRWKINRKKGKESFIYRACQKSGSALYFCQAFVMPEFFNFMR